MDKLKYIKIENEDGSLSDNIPLGVDAENVDVTSADNSQNLADYISVNDGKINSINSQINDLQDSDTSLSNQIKSLSSGSPKGSYATVNALKSANPETGVYVVTENGHIYSWTKDAESAVDLGIYQATGVNTDTTLKIQGEPADSYATGKAIKNINNNINFDKLNLSNSLFYQVFENSQLTDFSRNGLNLTKNINELGELEIVLNGQLNGYFSHMMSSHIKNFTTLLKNMGVKNLVLEFKSNYVFVDFIPRLKIDTYVNSIQKNKYMYLNEKLFIDLTNTEFINSLVFYTDNTVSPQLNGAKINLSLKADLTNLIDFSLKNSFVEQLKPGSLENLSINGCCVLSSSTSAIIEKNTDAIYQRYTHKFTIKEIGLYNINIQSNGLVTIFNEDYSKYHSIDNTSILYMEPGTYYVGFYSSNFENNLKYSISITKNNNVLFFDDFENFKSNIWKKENRNGYNSTESQKYYPENIAVNNSNLIITAQKLNNIWKSGSIISGGGIEINNNILIEAKIKFDKLFNGMWPAFWLSGCRYTPLFPVDLWPEHGEIDIIEVYQHANNNFITSNVWKSNQQQLLNNYKNFQLDNNYHIFAVKITDNSIAFYIDGKLYNLINIDDTIADNYSPYTDNNNSLCLHFNFAIETQYDDNNDIEANMLVDWIKITAINNQKKSLGFDFNINTPITVGNYSNIIANIDKSAQLKQLKFFSLNENIAKIGWDTEQNIPDLSPCKIYGISKGNVQIMGIDSNNNIIVKNFTVT